MMEPFNPPPIFIEINPATLRVWREGGGVELPLQRAPDGRLTAVCRKELAASLQKFLGRKSWQMRARAYCGISGHGVSLRRIALPAMAEGELEGVVRLQIEKEFPLLPDELAWGWREISGGARREAVVAAVRKEVIGDYATVLSEAGANPEFTVSAFARELLCPGPAGPHGLLQVERTGCELALFEDRVAIGVKILPANGDLADAVLKHSSAGMIYVSGTEAALAEAWGQLSARLKCQRLEVPGGAGCSAATLGLKKSVLENVPLLRLQTKAPPARTAFSFSKVDFSRAETRRWLARAAALLVLLLVLPYAEAVLLKPLLAWKLAAVKNQRQQFVSVVEPELHFLQSLKQSQPPYLDAMYLFSQAASPGLRLDSFTINQQGNITLKAVMQNAQQVTDFRAKLIGSGFFANITVEEQTPVPNQPKVNVRMSAQWKPAGARVAPKIEASPDETAKTNSAGNAAMPPAAGKSPQP